VIIESAIESLSMMKQYEIPAHIFVSKVPNHQELKPKILEAIEREPSQSVRVSSQKISKTDFFKEPEPEIKRSYYDIIKSPIENHLKEVCDKLQMQLRQASYFWFQQYEYGDFHNYHTHDTGYSCVYYVQLESESPKTTFIYMGNEFEFNVNEGDILTFPSYLMHRSKPNFSKFTKTIVACNFETDPDEYRISVSGNFKIKEAENSIIKGVYL
jgi:hypothetical protein